jgi:hypothetical protein
MIKLITTAVVFLILLRVSPDITIIGLLLIQGISLFGGVINSVLYDWTVPELLNPIRLIRFIFWSLLIDIAFIVVVYFDSAQVNFESLVYTQNKALILMIGSASAIIAISLYISLAMNIESQTRKIIKNSNS